MAQQLEAFEQYSIQADLLIGQATREQLAECMRLLALIVARYQIKHGEISLNSASAMLKAGDPNDEQLLILTMGMENLVNVLRNVVTGIREIKH
ncbi:hypothetical protein [Nitrosospira sp. NpAV]|uniref:hypothetical protein n=1 Tax=Nitrosospira sp. NpAV TaxID=58133 RepID=UPI0005A13B9A|nr:hypothetical protein [Nitrosospira sp. NpAV]KIO49919.1 hypothetical protein SQ11_03130 [Nitrosospira sp. NpAV]